VTTRCSFCGLPFAAGAGGTAPLYCCSGCRFAAGVAGADGEVGVSRWALARLAVAVFLSLNVMVFTMALWARDLGAGGGPLDAVLAGLFRYLSLLFALPVVWLLGGTLAAGAIESWRAGRPSADLLMLSGVVAAVALSAVAVVRDDGPVYFEVACAVLVLVTIGRWLEANGKLRAGDALRGLERLLPDTVRRVRNEREERVRAAEVMSGDVIRVLPGERLASDGILVRHAATFDEQMLTGESRPVVRAVGETVHAGVLAVDGDAWVQATASGGESTATRFLALVRQSIDARGGYVRLAERATRWFLPVVAAVAVATAVVHGFVAGAGAGVLAGLAVVLIACPCALGVATPLAVWAAVGRSARQGVLFRTPDALERLGTIAAIHFDKTGTLTTGQPKVTAVRVAPGEEVDTLWSDAAALASASNHPYSVALVEAARAHGVSASRVGRVQSVSGRGLESEAAIALGSPEFLAAAGYQWPEALADACRRDVNAGSSVCALGRSGAVCGFFVLHEQLRPEARSALDALTRQGLEVAILTGDHPTRAAAVSAELGVPAVGGLSPQGKVEAVLSARRSHGPIAAVGDGLNDAAALAAADAGIALGCGADVTREVADVCLLGDDLRCVGEVIALARRTRRTIRQNLFWAFAYNTAGIGLAMTGHLNPIWAALAMVVSSFSVLGNSLRLARPTGEESLTASGVNLEPARVAA